MRADSSASMTGTPSSAKRWATVLLPLAMPPVSPMRSCVVMRSMLKPGQAQVTADQAIAVHHGDPSCGGQVWAEGYGCGPIAAAQNDHQNTQHGTGSRRQQNDQRQQFPAQPGAQRRE